MENTDEMVRRFDRVYDELLVLLTQQGDADAAERLAARWWPRHLVHARRMLDSSDSAPDAVQDAWVDILRGIARLRDPARFPAWSYSIVTRRCHDASRRRKRQPSEPLPEEVADPSEVDAGDGHDLRRAIAALPAEQRAALALYYREGLSVSDVAEALGVPTGTVKSRLFHARRALRRHFRGEIHERVGRRDS